MVASTGNWTLRGLTLTGGSTPAPGGAIFNLQGTLTVNRLRGHRQLLVRAG